MAAYVILDISVHDPDTYEDYKKLSTQALASYGGKFLVRGGTAETVEGNWNPNRMVVLEFESMDRAKAWYASEEYAPALKIRHSAANANMIFVEGA